MINFKKRLLFNVYYFVSWIVYFVFLRLFFLLYHIDKTKELGLFTVIKTFLYGLQLDIAFTAYLSIIPFLLMILSVYINSKKIGTIIKWYSSILLVFINLLLLIDAGLYQSWGVRLDTSILPYLNTPELMVASVSSFQLIFGILFWVLLSVICIKIFKTIINKKIKKVRVSHWIQIPAFLL